MKRWMTTVILLVCVLGMAACKQVTPEEVMEYDPVEIPYAPVQYEEPVSNMFRTAMDGSVLPVDISEEEQEEIVSILNNGAWIYEAPKCEPDYSFETKDEKIYYHSECGTFDDSGNMRCLILSETEKEKVNRLLKADVHVVKIYETKTSEEEPQNNKLKIFVKHYEMSDGTWKTENHTYQYRLEKTGRVHNAASDTTFVFLSNLENITFEQMWKAAGFSSNLNDYFDADVAKFVGMK